MIGGFTRAIDNLFGRGDAAVTVPPLDGAMRPNRALDEAATRWALDGVDCLASSGGALLAATRTGIHSLDADGAWTSARHYGAAVASIAQAGGDGLAIAFDNGEILLEGGAFDGRRYRPDGSIACITAMAFADSALYVANGSATHGVDAWQRDLLERNATGSVWRIDLDSGKAARIADGLAWPAGLAADAGGLVVAEAWRHQLVRIEWARPRERTVLHADLPGYPGRMSPASDGYWMAMFAPRSQLVEFVLREPGYRKRMMAEVPQDFWVTPKLRTGRSFYESLQGGGVKHLGMLKPWAPTMSAGICVRLDAGFQPRASLQSRADGTTHGVTSAVEHEGRVFVAARGDGVIVSLPSSSPAADRGSGT